MPTARKCERCGDNLLWAEIAAKVRTETFTPNDGNTVGLNQYGPTDLLCSDCREEYKKFMGGRSLVPKLELVSGSNVVASRSLWNSTPDPIEASLTFTAGGDTSTGYDYIDNQMGHNY